MRVMNPDPWTSASFTAPFTQTGRSSLVPPPPWHHAGWLGITVTGARDA